MRFLLLLGVLGALGVLAANALPDSSTYILEERLLLVVAGVWLTMLLVTYQRVRTVQRLAEAAQRIAAGDLHTPLPQAEEGELGAMTSALERVRSQLLTSKQLARWNKTLETQVVTRAEELCQQQAVNQQLLRRVIMAQEEERSRIARDMHDGISQILAAIGFSVDALEKSLPSASSETGNAAKHLQRIRMFTEQSISDLRRIIAALRPGILDQLGLVAALAWLGDHILQPHGLGVTFETDNLPERLPQEIETILFRIAQEALNNIMRHSQATHVTIRLTYATNRVLLTVADNGQGYDPLVIRTPRDLGYELGCGLGIAGMKERAALAGGKICIESAPSQGTTVQVTIPITFATSQVEPQLDNIFITKMPAPAQQASRLLAGI